MICFSDHSVYTWGVQFHLYHSYFIAVNRIINLISWRFNISYLLRSTWKSGSAVPVISGWRKNAVTRVFSPNMAIMGIASSQPRPWEQLVASPKEDGTVGNLEIMETTSLKNHPGNTFRSFWGFLCIENVQAPEESSWHGPFFGRGHVSCGDGNDDIPWYTMIYHVFLVSDHCKSKAWCFAQSFSIWWCQGEKPFPCALHGGRSCHGTATATATTGGWPGWFHLIGIL